MNSGLLEIRGVARGEKRALAALYEMYAGQMLALGQRIMRRPKEAEDILHDVFLEVWKRAGDYDPRRGTVKTWLFLRMRSRCLDRLKSAGYARATGLDEVTEPTSQGAHLEQLTDGARVRECVSGLPEAQSKVLVLGYFGGFSSSQIAETLGIPIGTVKSRVAAGLSALRAQLGAASGGVG